VQLNHSEQGFVVISTVFSATSADLDAAQAHVAEMMSKPVGTRERLISGTWTAMEPGECESQYIADPKPDDDPNEAARFTH